MWSQSAIFLCVLVLQQCVSCTISSAPLHVPVLRSAICEANKYVGITPKRETCPPQKCNWQKWYKSHYEQPTGSAPVRVVLSYGHHGLGNQFYQHNFAQMAAAQTNSTFYATEIPTHYYPKGGDDISDTIAGFLSLKAVMDPNMLWENLPPNHTAKALCSANNITIGYRPEDKYSPRKEWNRRYQDFINPVDPAKCLVLVGYFAQFLPCLQTLPHMWRGVFEARQSDTFGANDIVIHMRCLGSFYYAPHKLYIEAVLNRSKYDQLYILKPPGKCKNSKRTNDNTNILKLLETRYGAVYYQSPNGTGLADFLALSSARQVIETASTFSRWGGMLTSQDATVHVDVSFHPIVPGDHRYVYHDHHTKKFYGVYNPIDQKIHYEYVDTEFVCEFEARVTSKGRNSGLYNHTKFAAGHEPR